MAPPAPIPQSRRPAGLRRLWDGLWPERRRRARIDAVCIGYSGRRHWRCFKEMLAAPDLRRILVLGVYYGRDIAYMASILSAAGRAGFEITGVDKFEDAACEDWPEELRGKSWREAGFGEAPALERARRNLESLALADGVTLRRARAEEFLESSTDLYDLVYIDISHDYESTRRTIDLAVPRVAPGGVIAGDDFSDKGTWGVARAVREAFENYRVHSDWIWQARPEDYRAPD